MKTTTPKSSLVWSYEEYAWKPSNHHGLGVHAPTSSVLCDELPRLASLLVCAMVTAVC